ncbi:hypothetical protein ACFWAR_13440 [Streptomyces sp. NPDC059917]|uniref:hypothetical protein n=1 Tax=Streptomyces sp. NPDC059917 TaxID=3347002 RepID=UPI0036672663
MRALDIDAERYARIIERAEAMEDPHVLGLCVLHNGSLAVVKRRSAREPWTGRLRDRLAYRLPKARPRCDVHDPLFTGGAA